jgi:serine/threonine-protein kinase
MLGGRYQIEAPIGEGGMARVFRAHDGRLDRTVAIKVLREQFTHEQEFVDRFRQEARLAAGLSHPAIVGVYDVGVDQGRHYMVMEYVEGETLRALIARQAPMPLEAVIPLMRQLAAALDYAHDHGVIHRDIKPENILITQRGEVKVGDFGIARALASAGLTATGTVLGSVSYFSPEQASGQAATAE